jgi:hypothetical protein
VIDACEEIAAIIVRDTAYAAASDAKVGMCAERRAAPQRPDGERCSEFRTAKSRAAAILMPTMHKPLSP